MCARHFKQHPKAVQGLNLSLFVPAISSKPFDFKSKELLQTKGNT
jgi:hypothetical protein